jgi:hypothetical protein
MSAVWPLVLPRSEKFVLLALADNANDDGVCWPSVQTIARKTCTSEREVQRALADLEKMGQITRNYRTGRSVVYQVHPRQHVTPDAESPRQDVTDSYDTASPPPLTHGHPESSVEPTKKRQGKAPKAKFVLPDWVPVEQWEAYCEARVKIKKPMTDFAKELAVAKLHALKEDGHHPAAVLANSAFNAWQGLWAPKG